jgi:hypothetical protein
MTELNTLAKLPKYSKVGIVVKSVKKTVEYYTKTFGWGPWLVSDHVDIGTCVYKGKPEHVILNTALYPNPFEMGDDDSERMMIELIEPVEGESPFMDFLKTNGDGIQLLQIIVDDLNATLAELSKNNCEQIFRGQWEMFGINMDVAFVEGPQLGGVQYEIIQMG